MLKITDIINVDKYKKHRIELLEYLKMNKDLYPEDISYNMIYIIKNDILLENCGFIGGTLMELLSKFDMLNNNQDVYLLFASMLYDYNLLAGNCMDVAAGYYPRLSEIINPTIEGSGFRLSIYDPNLIVSRIGSAKLYKEKFTKETDIKGIDTLFGMYTCNATIALVEKAVKENKNLLVALCSCDHETKMYPRFSPTWANSFCKLIKNRYPDEIKILSWPEQTQIDTPIMLRKKR